MIRTVAPRTNPAIATAMPVKALSSEITTGMSAPPIGSTMVTPNTSAARQVTTRAIRLLGSTTSHTMPATNATASRALSARIPGNVTGLPETTPCSLPAAINEPVKVTPPMVMSSPAVSAAVVSIAPPAVRSWIASSAAAPPPTALKRLTSCGIPVIFTVRAMTRPAPPPTANPAAATIHPVADIACSTASRTMVARIAQVIATMEMVLPRRAVLGEFIRCRPMTKHDAAARNTSRTTVSVPLTGHRRSSPGRRSRGRGGRWSRGRRHPGPGPAGP
jgi:hypothetical protein